MNPETYFFYSKSFLEKKNSIDFQRRINHFILRFPRFPPPLTDTADWKNRTINIKRSTSVIKKKKKRKEEKQK